MPLPTERVGSIPRPGPLIDAMTSGAAPGALEALFEEAVRNRVLISTPTTLIALIKAIAYGWQQENLARNIREVATLARDLYERIGTFGSGRASGAPRPDKPESAPCTFWISCGRSLTATLLLLTWAATMSAVRVIRVSSCPSSMMNFPELERTWRPVPPPQSFVHYSGNSCAAIQGEY